MIGKKKQPRPVDNMISDRGISFGTVLFVRLGPCPAAVGGKAAGALKAACPAAVGGAAGGALRAVASTMRSLSFSQARNCE